MQLYNNTVDINVKVGDEFLDFKQLPATLSIANYGNTVVSENKELMCNEVESAIKSSKDIIESIPYHEKIIEKSQNRNFIHGPEYDWERHNKDACLNKNRSRPSSFFILQATFFHPLTKFHTKSCAKGKLKTDRKQTFRMPQKHYSRCQNKTRHPIRPSSQHFSDKPEKHHAHRPDH